MSKRINLIISSHIYTVEELAELLNVTPWTIRRWIGLGHPVCGRNPYLIRGRDAKDFLKKKSKRVRLKDQEFYCLGCKQPIRVPESDVTIEYTGRKLSPTKMQIIRTAICPKCGAKMNRFSSVPNSEAKEYRERGHASSNLTFRNNRRKQ